MSLLLIFICIIAGIFTLIFMRAARQLKSDLEKHFGGRYPMIPFDNVKKLTELIRNRNVLCTRCKRQASAILGSGNMYRCDTCHETFAGPSHIPTGVG